MYNSIVYTINRTVFVINTIQLNKCKQTYNINPSFLKTSLKKILAGNLVAKKNCCNAKAAEKKFVHEINVPLPPPHHCFNGRPTLSAMCLYFLV